MAGIVPRLAEASVERKLRESPVVAILGPRQSGKTTLAKRILAHREAAVRLDLERPSDLAKLQDSEAYFRLHREKLVCLDEIQRRPDLFPVLRSVVDEREGSGQFLILGSASPELLRQSSESLAGRIAFVELRPFLLPEVEQVASGELHRLWLRGGFPRSFLAESETGSLDWREDFIRTFLERDLALYAPRLAPERLATFWTMCAHEHGQLLNASRLGDALGVSGHTIRAYLELLERTFMLRLLRPLHANLGKRLVRSPRLFVRDAGILHALLRIASHDDLIGHPSRGVSWEGLVIEHAIAAFARWQPSFFRTRSGAELDLILEKGHRRLAIEAKVSSAPRPTRGFWSALEDLGITEAYVVAPVDEPYPLAPGVAVLPLGELMAWAPRIAAGTPHPAAGA
ncbi:MAG: ATP-binding protein [Acidobacteria bacterium]|nr:ATP-binding protein [Acidobacteriota bacterium]